MECGIPLLQFGATPVLLMAWDGIGDTLTMYDLLGVLKVYKPNPLIRKVT